MKLLKSIRGFSSFDFLTLVTSVTAVAAISGPIIHRNIQSGNLNAAERNMKKLAFEIAQIGPRPSLDPSSRAPASQGAADEQILTQADPWGRPYHLKYLRNSYGIPTHLVIWSLGPNGSQDTHSIESNAKGGAQAVIFEGDDVGYVTTIR